MGVLLALLFAWVIANWTERGVRAGLEKRNLEARSPTTRGTIPAASTSTSAQSTRQATTRACKLSLDEAGIGIPFPQQDVHLDESLIKALSN
ncbi:MAG: hypothetical protein JRI98_13795 [Deltaproteobacteria bacterium]|nr:hypothetical protein [Deltaproteobacteria bacterium]